MKQAPRPSPFRAPPAPALVLAIALPTLLVASAPAHGRARHLERPVTSQGSIRFTVDTASFASEGSETREEVYLQIPSTELLFKPRGKDLIARLEVAIAVRDTAGRAVVERKVPTELPVRSAAEAHDPAEVHVLQSEFSLAPGPYKVEVRVKDLERREMAVPLIIFLRRNASGKASFPLEVPAIPDSGLSISDIQFAREIQDDGTGSPFRKGRYGITPCADRVYGLLIPELRLYFEISDRVHDESGAGELVQVAYEVRTMSDAMVAVRQEELLLHEGTNWARTAAFDLSRIPPGQYRAVVNVTKPSTAEETSASATFDVIWSAYSWNRKVDDLIAELAPVATSDDQKRLKRLSSGERENFLAEFWKRLDPTPDTPRNEAFEEHHRRIRMADRAFGVRVRGILTDRGRIYVRYGQPDEISSGFATEEFIGSFLWNPKNEFDFSEEGRARGGYNFKDKAYETWTYDNRGEPLGASARIGSGVGLRFVFVDVSGYGDYEMVHSSESVEY